MKQKISTFDEFSRQSIQEGNSAVSETTEISRVHSLEKARELDNSKTEFLANSNKAITATEARREELARFFAQQQEEMRRFQEQVMSQVSTLLSSFVAERESAIKERLQAARTELTGSASGMPTVMASTYKIPAMSSFHTDFADSISTLQENAEQFSSNIAKIGAEQKTRNERYETLHANTVSSLLGEVTSLAADAAQSCVYAVFSLITPDLQKFGKETLPFLLR